MQMLYKYEGKNKEEIENKILSELNTSKEDLFIKVREEEGTWFKAKKYIYEVAKKEDIITFVKNYIEELSNNFGVEIKSEVRFKEDILYIVLVSENNAIIIGKEGRTLAALQTLIKNTLNNKIGFNIKINLDASNYKAKKQKNLEYEIKKIAKDVLRSHVDVKLDPMNSYDRRCVHNVVSKFENLKSESFGENPNRYVVISYKGE